MFGRLFNSPCAMLLLVVLLAVAGCEGGNTSATRGAGATLEAQTFNEDCALCHKSGGIVDVAAVHSSTDTLIVTISAVSMVGSNQPQVDFTVVNEATMSGVGGLSGFGFIITKLVPGTGGDADAWQSYINSLQDVAAPPTGWAPAQGAPNTTGSATQATLEGDKSYVPTLKGTLTDLGLAGTGRFGDYRYTFASNLATVTDPKTAAPIGYDPSLTHRLAVESPRYIGYAGESVYVDFVPSALPTMGPGSTTRDMVVDSACNECHVNLALHGNHRIDAAYCVTCHNPGTTDPHSGNTVDFKVMVHKIHRGEHLPSIADNGGEYAIWGHYNAKHDYSTVVLPQDVRFPGLGQANSTCTKCHTTGDAADSDNWNTVPTMEACGSCHDTTSFVDPAPAGFTLMPGGAQADNSGCTGCHLPTGPPDPPTNVPPGIVDAHMLPQQVAGVKYQYNIVSVTDQNDDAQVDPGDFVKVTFSVTDPTNADAPYDILNDTAFTSPAGGASRLAIDVGWDSSDYTNTGGGHAPAQPISLDPLSIGLTPATDNGDGTFSITTASAIPAYVTGSGVVAIEGHPAGDFDGDGTYSDRIPVKNVFQNFAITGTTEARRTVVSLDKCNACHGNLSLHGNNRTGEIQVCVICHNADATDINVRPADPTTSLDGKVEEAIDFKYMIHAIHAGAADDHGYRENGIVVYGYHGSVHDYSHVRMPAGLENLKNCSGCHEGSTFEVPPDPDALPTTISTGYNPNNASDDMKITPTSSVCASCHDSIESKTHMSAEGGQFEFEPYGSGTGGGEAALCGPGADKPAGHSIRTDCCSCHSFQ